MRLMNYLAPISIWSAVCLQQEQDDVPLVSVGAFH